MPSTEVPSTRGDDPDLGEIEHCATPAVVMFGALMKPPWRREAERPLLDDEEEIDSAPQPVQPARASITAPRSSNSFQAPAIALPWRRVPPETTAAASRGRWRAAAALLVHHSTEGSILGYASLVCGCGATGLFCLPSIPFVWTCAGVLPLVSVLTVMTCFGAAYVVSLLPGPANLYPAAALTAAMTSFYTLRFAGADKSAVHGLLSFGDLLLAFLSMLQLALLARGVSSRRRSEALPR